MFHLTPLLLVAGASLQVTNLSLAADMTHRWYHDHFKTYPASRRALFPFLY